jgi:hypothetical protein
MLISSRPSLSTAFRSNRDADRPCVLEISVLRLGTRNRYLSQLAGSLAMDSLVEFVEIHSTANPAVSATKRSDAGEKC